MECVQFQVKDGRLEYRSLILRETDQPVGLHLRHWVKNMERRLPDLRFVFGFTVVFWVVVSVLVWSVI